MAFGWCLAFGVWVEDDDDDDGRRATGDGRRATLSLSPSLPVRTDGFGFGFCENSGFDF